MIMTKVITIMERENTVSTNCSYNQNLRNINIQTYHTISTNKNLQSQLREYREKGGGETETETETERQRDRDRQTETDRQRQRQRTRL